jgi:NIMA (never in mitosis gene a)-related kinase
MDFADGGDLYTKIAQYKKAGKTFEEEQILEWFLQICLALKHIHSRKILHRDLKTQNIFLTSKGEVKIGDFGIARVLQHTYDCVQTAIGTPYYLSPEICQEKPYNQKSDIWSMGCILYEMLTLRHAFDANSMKGLVLKILKGNYPPIPSAYSEDIRGLVGELLIKDPAKRPSIRQILEKPFLKSRINNLIAKTVAKYELSNGPKPVSASLPGSAASSQAKPSSKKLESEVKTSEKKASQSKVLQSHPAPQPLHLQAQEKGSKMESVKISEKNVPKMLEESKDSSNIHESDDEEENLHVLINSLKNVVEPKEGKQEDENFAEEEKDRVYAKYC